MLFAETLSYETLEYRQIAKATSVYSLLHKSGPELDSTFNSLDLPILFMLHQKLSYTGSRSFGLVTKKKMKHVLLCLFVKTEQLSQNGPEIQFNH